MGRIKLFHTTWEKITSDPFVLDIVANGVKVELSKEFEPFYLNPYPFKSKHNCKAVDD